MNRNKKKKTASCLLKILVVFIMTLSAANVFALQVDIGPTSQIVQSGWDELSFDPLGVTTASGSYTSALANSGTIGIELNVSDNSMDGAATLVKPFARTASGALADLIADFGYTSPGGLNGMEIVLQDLTAGYYTVTLYLNDPGYLRNDCQVHAIDAASGGVYRILEFAQSHTPFTDSDDPALSTPEFVVQADGTNDVVIRLTATYSGGGYDNVVLNGFEVATAAGFPPARPDLDVDFGPSDPNELNAIEEGQAVQAGFEEFSFANPNDNLTSATNVYDCELGMGHKVSVSIEEEKANQVYNAIDTFARSSALTTYADLLNDFVYMYEDMSITLSNLKPGYYQITTYHNDPGYPRPPVDILIQDFDGANIRTAKLIVDQTGADDEGEDVSSVSYVFKSNGGDVKIFFEGWVGNYQASNTAPVSLINGFELDAATAWTLDVDFGSTGQVLQSGFEEFTSSGGATVSNTYTNVLGAAGTVEVELAATGAVATQVNFANGSDLSSNLLNDLATASPTGEGSELTLTLRDLLPDVYTLYTHHNQPSVKRPTIDIEINGEVVSTQFAQSDVDTDGQATSVHAATFEVASAEDIAIKITSNSGEGTPTGDELVLATDMEDWDTFNANWTPSGGSKAQAEIVPGHPYYENDGQWAATGWPDGKVYYLHWNYASLVDGKAYHAQLIDTAVEGKTYELNADLGYRLYAVAGHAGDVIYSELALAIVDSDIEPTDPNDNMTDYIVYSISKSSGPLPDATVGVTMEHKAGSYTATAADAGKDVYAILYQYVDDISGSIDSGMQSFADNVSIIGITPGGFVEGPVINGFELMAGQADPTPLRPLYCGDYGTVYLQTDGNRDCEVNLGDLAYIYMTWMQCNDPMGDCN